MKITTKNYVKMMKMGNQDALKFFIEQDGWQIKVIVQKKLYLFPNEQEDCINEIFFAIWNNVRKYDSKKASFSTWISAVSRYVILNYFRKLKNRQFEDSIDHTQTKDIENGSILNDIIAMENDSFEELISCLPERDRDIFRMFFLQEKECTEISDCTGLKKEILYNHISRGKRKIKQRIMGDQKYERYF